MSDDGSDTCPSTEKQLALAERLCEDLRAIGLSDARVDMYGYVYASVEKTVEGAPSIGFIAHMDTALEMPDHPIRPRTVI
jgi:tripeptide aminopeptidase